MTSNTEPAAEPSWTSSSQIGFLTLGQSPRPDMMDEMRALVGGGVECVEAGALDGLDSDSIRRLKPGAGDFPLLTRLADGASVEVGKKQIIPLLQRRVEDLENGGARAVALLCTEEFPGLSGRRILLSPWDLMRRTVAAILPVGTIGILAPLPEQEESMRKRWEQATGLKACVQILAPYEQTTAPQDRIGSSNDRTATPGHEEVDWSRIADGFLREGVDLIVLDCFGYTREFQERLYQAARKPVLYPRALLTGWIQTILVSDSY